jgi:hypothetical protein
MRYPDSVRLRIRYPNEEGEMETVTLRDALEADIVYISDDEILPTQSGVVVESWTGKVDRNFRRIYEGDKVKLFDIITGPLENGSRPIFTVEGVVMYSDVDDKYMAVDIWGEQVYELYGEMEVSDE